MAIDLSISGYLNVSIFGVDGTPVTKEVEAEVLDKLQNGVLYLNLEDRIIHGSSFEQIAYLFQFSVTESIEYEFEEIVEEGSFDADF